MITILAYELILVYFNLFNTSSSNGQLNKSQNELESVSTGDLWKRQFRHKFKLKMSLIHLEIFLSFF